MKKKISDAELRTLAAKMTRQEIAKETGLSYDTIRKRIKKLMVNPKESVKQVIITPETVRDDVNNIVKKEQERVNDRKLKILAQELLKVEKERDALLCLGNVETYKIAPREKSNGRSRAIAITLASDWHYEEPIKLSQTNGLNKFNTEIAKDRIENYFKVVSKLIEVHNKEYQIDDLVLALLGDFISGSIHDDLKEANDIQPTQAIWEVQNLIASGIEFLLSETKVNLIIPCSSGNHGRITEKQRTATEFGNSLEILMYRQLEKHFTCNSRVRFIINDSYLTYVKVFGFTLRFHHGHALKFSGGIGGLFIPAYKAISQWNKSLHADWDFFGHFHQLKDGGNFVSNGSLVGFNAYAVKIKADYERPKQFFGILDEERGLEVTRKITL